MATQKKPTILFITGAWHRPHLYEALFDALRSEKGYTKILAPTLPSIGGTDTSFDADVATVRQCAVAALDEGDEVVVLMHSYGGVVGSEAVRGLDARSRGQQGKPGAVVQLIYVCAFAVPEGMSLMDGLGGMPLPWFQAVASSSASSSLDQWALRTTDIFHNGVSDPAVLEFQKKELLNQAKGSFDTKATYAAWKDTDRFRTAYVVCELDLAIPQHVQDGMVKQPGANFKVERLNTGHSPWLSMPDGTIDTLDRLVMES